MVVVHSLFLVSYLLFVVGCRLYVCPFCWLLVDCHVLFGVCVAKRVVCRVMCVVVCHVFVSFVMLRFCWSWLCVNVVCVSYWLVVYCL